MSGLEKLRFVNLIYTKIRVVWETGLVNELYVYFQKKNANCISEASRSAFFFEKRDVDIRALIIALRMLTTSPDYLKYRIFKVAPSLLTLNVQLS